MPKRFILHSVYLSIILVLGAFLFFNSRQLRNEHRKRQQFEINTAQVMLLMMNKIINVGIHLEGAAKNDCQFATFLGQNHLQQIGVTSTTIDQGKVATELDQNSYFRVLLQSEEFTKGGPPYYYGLEENSSNQPTDQPTQSK